MNVECTSNTRHLACSFTHQVCRTAMIRSAEQRRDHPTCDTLGDRHLRDVRAGGARCARVDCVLVHSRLRLMTPVLVSTLLGCGRPPQVQHPRIPDRASNTVEERQSLYAASALEAQPQLARTLWRRDGGEPHSWAELEDLASVYPETRALRSAADLRDSIFTWLVLPGLVVLPGTAIHQLAASDEQDFSTGTATALYVTGGASLGLALLFKLLVPDPKSEFAQAYNGNLREELGLTAPSD